MIAGNLLLDFLLKSPGLADGFGKPGYEPKVAYSDVEPDKGKNREDYFETDQNRVSQVDGRARQTQEVRRRNPDEVGDRKDGGDEDRDCCERVALGATPLYVLSKLIGD